MSSISWDFNFADKTKHSVTRVGAIPINMGVETASASMCDSVKHTFYGITCVILKPCFQCQKTRQ